MSESKFYHFSSDGLFYGVSSVKEAITASKEGGFIWLNFYNPTAEELHSLIDTMGIHPLSVEDCLDSNRFLRSNSSRIIHLSFSMLSAIQTRRFSLMK
jgi:Mg2+ and Co2+ transporter CorA